MNQNIRPRATVRAPQSTPLAQAARQALLTLALASGAALLQTAHAQQPAAAHRVPAGPLGEVLTRFAADAGVALQLDAALVAGRSSPGLQGRFDVREGLERLLAGTGLKAQERSGGVWVLLRVADETELPLVRVKASAERHEAGARTVPARRMSNAAAAPALQTSSATSRSSRRPASRWAPPAAPAAMTVAAPPTTTFAASKATASAWMWTASRCPTPSAARR